MGNLISHRELVERGAKWLKTKAPNIHLKCQFVLAEFVCQGGFENPDILGLRPYGHVLIEVKVSRADFRKDCKKLCRRDERMQIGSYRFYLAPKGMINQEELPENWGLLEWNGKDIEVTRDSDKFEECFQTVGYYYHSLLRRMHKSQVFDFRKKKDGE